MVRRSVWKWAGDPGRPRMTGVALPERPVRVTPGPTAPPHHEELVSGGGTFVDDVHRPGALTAVVVRSMEAHGRLLAVATDEARTMPGVHAVLTASDLPRPAVIPIRSFERPGMAAAVQPVLAADHVRYAGEPVAVVVAENAYLAEDAAESVAVDVEPLPPVVEPAASGDAMVFDRLAGNLLCRFDTAHGDLERVLGRAAVVVEEEFRTVRHTGLPLETRGLVAEWSDAGRRLELWGATKFLSFNREVVAGWFGVPVGDVVVHRVSVGGMFGVRGEIYPEDFLVPWAALATGRPVRWVEDRREHLLATNHAPGLRYAIRVGLDGDGRLVGLGAEIDLDMGAYARGNGGRLALLAIEELVGPYLWEATSIVASGWVTNTTPVGSVRAPVALESTFARERAIELAAARLGRDSADVRRQSLVPAAAMPFTRRFGGDGHDLVYADGDFPAFYERLLRVSRFGRLRTARDRRRSAGELVGVGTALFVAHSGLGGEERVEVGVQDGRIVVQTAASEVGQGLDRLVRLVVSETLGVPGHLVDSVSGGHTGQAWTAGTYSSRLAIFVGNAVRDGCRRLVGEAGPLLADRTPVVPEELEGLSVTGVYRDTRPTFGFGGNVALVSVDRECAVVQVEELALVVDCGRPLDRPSVLGQLHGGTAHGLGVTLLEQLCYDEDGQPLSLSFMDYLVPTGADIPGCLRIELLDGWATTNPLGVKGAGEAGVVGVGAAVANAVADALGPTGACVTRLPLSPRGIDVLLPAMNVGAG